MTEEKTEAVVCAHCGQPVSSSVYQTCGSCGQPVCEACAPERCCRKTEEHEPKADEPAEGA